VKVRGVNTMNRKGKRKRTGWVFGHRSDVKRALVKLAPGESIDIFEV
jgi:large subunit ribosomal protein L23